MKVIFCGGFFPETELQKIVRNSIGAVVFANHTFQTMLLKGLRQVIGKEDLYVVSMPQIGAFPLRYKSVFYKGFLKGVHEYTISFFNLPVLKHYGASLGVKRFLKRSMDCSGEEKVYCILYDLQPAFMKNLIRLKRQYPAMEIISVIPDLPGMTGCSSRGLYGWWTRRMQKRSLKFWGFVDKFVVFARPMIEKIPIAGRPVWVLEGVCDTEDIPENESVEPGLRKIIFYSGSLQERNGILNLVEAFRRIEEDTFELVICGAGDTENEIKKAAAADKRIRFIGQVGREEVLRLQKKATLLVNPRTPEGEFTRYSFPSKVMEYFASGVPVLMYKLEGIPEEYYNYCYTLEGSATVDDLKDELVRICGQPQEILKKMGTAACMFVKEHKNLTEQSRKLLSFITCSGT